MDLPSRLAALVLAVSLVACVAEAPPPPAAWPEPMPNDLSPPPVRRSASAAPAASAAPPPANGEGVAAGVRFVERVTGGASPSQPLVMVVAIHGRGGDPHRFFEHFFGGFSEPARFILPVGDRFGRGYQWWERTRDRSYLADRVAAQEVRIAEAVANLVRARPTVGRVVVCGYSQGGMLTFALASRHPTLFAEGIALSGTLPPELRPRRIAPGAPVAPIHAFHGTEDELVPYQQGRETVAALRAAGIPAELVAYQGLGHAPHPEAMRDVRAHVSAAIRRIAATEARPISPQAPAAAATGY